MLMGPSIGKTAVHGYHHAVVAVRLQDYLESNERNEPLQSAYKRFPSSETTLTRVHNDILLETDNRHCVMLLLLDLSAAFDKATTIFYLKDLTLGSQFVVMLLTGFGLTLQTAHNLR